MKYELSWVIIMQKKCKIKRITSVLIETFPRHTLRLVKKISTNKTQQYKYHKKYDKNYFPSARFWHIINMICSTQTDIQMHIHTVIQFTNSCIQNCHLASYGRVSHAAQCITVHFGDDLPMQSDSDKIINISRPHTVDSS